MFSDGIAEFWDALEAPKRISSDDTLIVRAAARLRTMRFSVASWFHHYARALRPQISTAGAPAPCR